MYENITLYGTELAVQKSKELADIVLHDPEWQTLCPEGSDFRTTLNELKNYVQDDEPLQKMIGTMSLAIDQLLQPINGFSSFLMAGPGHNAICAINTLNGYQVSDEARAMNITKYSTLPESTEKTPGASMTERVYAYMERTGYAGIQDDPKAKMLIHLAHLSEKMMARLPELVMTSEVEKSGQELVAPADDPDQTGFFERLRNPEELECILDEKKLRAKQQENKEAIERNIATFNKAKKGDAEAIKDLVKSGMESHPEVMEAKVKHEAELRAKYRALREQELRESVAKYREKVIGKNEGNKELNEQLEAANRKAEIENAKIQKTIDEKQALRDKTLLAYREKQQQADALRAQRKADFEKLEDAYYQRKDALEERIEKLDDAYTDLAPILDAGRFVSDPKNIPPQSHFDAVEELSQRGKALDDVAYLLHQANRDRGEAFIAKVTPEADKKVAKLREDLNKLRSEKDTLDSRFAAADPTKQAELGEKVLNASEKYSTKAAELSEWEEAAKLQEKLNALWEKYPDMQKDYLQHRKKENPDDALYNMWKATDQAHLAEWQKYQGYYNKKKTFERVRERMEKRNISGIHEIEKMGAELQAARDELAGLQKPDKAAYDRESAELCSAIYNQQTAREEKAFEEQSRQELEWLEQQLDPIDELEVVLDDEGIEKEVEAYRQKQEEWLSFQDEAHISSEMKTLNEQNLKKLAQFGAENLQNRNYNLKQSSKNLEGARERAKELYQKAQKSYAKRVEPKAHWDQIKARPDRYAEGIEQELRALSENMLKGREKGHRDTPEFNRMKEAVDQAYHFVQNEENRKKLNALDKDTVAAFRGLMTNMKTQSESYCTEKRKGIHWSPSNMRFVRLQMADRLQKTADEMSSRFDKLQPLQEKKAQVQAQADAYKVDDPGETFYAYVTKMAPNATVKALYDKKAREMAPKPDTANLEKNGPGMVNAKC